MTSHEQREPSHNKGPSRKAPPGETRTHEGDVRPEDMPVFEIAAGEHYLPGLIVSAGLAKSNGDARKLVENSSVSFDGLKIRDTKAKVAVTAEHVLRTGKRAFIRIVAS